MQRTLVFVTILLALTIGLIVGCQDDGGPAGAGIGGGGEVASIALDITHGHIRGFVGERRTEQVTATARNIDGFGVEGVKIEFAIQAPQVWKGTIAAAGTDTATNVAGEFKAAYTVVLERSTNVVIEARSGQVSATKVVNIEIVQDILGEIEIVAAKQVLTVPPGRTDQTTVTASLSDTNGVAISGILVHFSTQPINLGTVDGDTGTTDFNGLVTKTFSSIVNRYGFCDIIAKVGERSASTTIEIRPRSEPCDIRLHTQYNPVYVLPDENRQVEIKAYVTDDNGRSVEGATVEFQVSGNPRFGSLVAQDTTDFEGKIVTTFHTLGDHGMVWLHATVLPSVTGGTSAGEGDDGGSLRVSRLTVSGKAQGVIAGINQGEITDSLGLDVILVNREIGDLIVNAFPNYLNIPPDSIAHSTIRAQVRDLQFKAIGGLNIDYEASHGTLSGITPTDSAGVSTAEWIILPQSDFPDDDRIEAEITASVFGMDPVTTTITVVKSASDVGTLTLNTDRQSIYADNGLTKASLTAVLKDADYQALAGRQVIFTATHGSVNSPVTTDSMGIARAELVDIGLPSVDPNDNPEPAVVIVKYNPMGLQAQVEIMILERNPVDMITLSAAANQMTAGSNDSCSARATCILENGDRAPDGTMVNFRAQIGRFTQDAVTVIGGFGVAETFYIAGNNVGTDVLTAFVVNVDGDTVVSNEWMITLLPGPPNNVRVSADPTSLPTNDPSAFSTITATVSDTANNPVEEGTMVTFETTLGSIDPNATTDDAGQAKVRLVPGVAAGIALVTATVVTPAGPITGQTTVRFISGQPNSIELTADPLLIQVVGTGGIETSTLRATVRDPNGNLMTATPVTVVFELIHEPPQPEGCNINNRGQLDSSNTSNGVAVVSLNSGTQIGGKLIRAYTWRDIETRQDTVQAVLSTVAVVSGPPYHLDIDVNDDGNDAGGGTWFIEVSAKVWDIFRNPVADRIPVVFSVNPEIASINPGYTGNVGQAGSSEPGLAYSNMYYHSSNTFDTLTISAEVQTAGGAITGEREHTLPMQEGHLDLYVDPANWMFPNGGEGHGPLARIRTWVVLKDGHDILINNGPILFTSVRARFYWYNWSRHRDEMFYPAPSKKYTGWRPPKHIEHNEDDGKATVFLLAEEADIFLDPFTLEVNVQFNAEVEGYDDVSADPAFVLFTRH